MPFLNYLCRFPGTCLVLKASVPLLASLFSLVGTTGAAPPSPVNDARSHQQQGAPKDWPQFLGPAGTGVSQETGLAKELPTDAPSIVWSHETGVGYAAPSVLGKRVVLPHRLDDEEIVECRHADTGETLWKQTSPTDFVDPYGYNGGPRATPLLTPEYCYTLGAAGHLQCLDLKTGNRIWERDLQKEYSIPEGFFGMACSPILYKNLLIILVGGQPDAGVVAFNAHTGEPVWNAVGKPTWDGATTSQGTPYEWTGEEMLVSYATPTLAEFHGKPHLLCLVRQGLVSLDPDTGDERFHYWFSSRAHESVNAARPVVVGNEILITASYRTGAALLRVTPDGFEEVWRDRGNLECHWPTPIVENGLIFGFSGRNENGATLRCLDWKTGSLLWEVDGSETVRDSLELDPFGRRFRDKETGKTAPWPYFGRASKIRVGERYIILGERGTLAFGQLDRAGYTEQARYAVSNITFPAWTAPVLANGRLYLRDEDSLVCLDLSQ